MRVLSILKTPSFAVVAVFICAAIVASKVPSPWREGPLLTLMPALPDALSQRVALVQWPEPEQDTRDFHFDLDLSTPLDVPEEANTVETRTAETSTAQKSTAPTPKKPKTAARTARSATQDSPTSEPKNAIPPAHERILAQLYGPAAAKDLSSTDHLTNEAPPEPRIDPRDKRLLASIRTLRAKLPSSGDFLHIPCTDAPADSGEPTDANAPADTDATDADASDTDAANPDAATSDAPQANAQTPDTTCALDNFYRSLRDRAFGTQGHTRWMQYGDSLVIGDTMTGELRRLFQQQFGDGGHGWLYIGNPLRPVRAENIRAYPTDAWYIRSIVRHSVNGGNLFGLGGAEFRPTDDSSLLLRVPRDDGPGDTFEHFALYYFAPPGVESGTFRLTVDGKSHIERIEPTPGSSGVHRFTVPPKTQEVRLSEFSSALRYYGLTSETSGPGVVVDNLGLVSGRQEQLLKLNPDQWHDQLAFRKPDVVAFFYGVNAASSNKGRMQARSKTYIEDYTKVIQRAMRDAPERDCLVLSLLTRGVREGNKIYPTGAVDVLNSAQKRTALSSGCAFFDTTGVMGGAESTDTWVNRRPPLLGTDLSHPTRPGYYKLARQLYANLMDGFIDYLERRTHQGGNTQ